MSESSSPYSHQHGSHRDSRHWRKLKEAVSITRILEAADKLSSFRRCGSRLVGPCPIHDGDNPRAFSVDPERGLWFCFSRCQRGGDSLALAWHLCGRSWARTTRWLEPLAARRLPEPIVCPNPGSGRTSGQRQFRPFTHALQLDPRHPFLGRMGLKEATVRAFEAGAWHGFGFLAGTVAVRLHDLEGRPLGYAGRLLDPERVRREGKWRLPPGYPKTRLLYNWHRARCHLGHGLVVVEGFWSIMKLAQAGYPNAIALGGIVITRPQVALLSRTSQVVLMLDGDPPGERATQRYVSERIHHRLVVVRPPAGKDPADLNEDALVRLLTPALSRPDRSRTQ